MNLLSRISAGAALALCLSLAAPVCADAAQGNAKSQKASRVEKNGVHKKTHKSAGRNKITAKKSSSKKTASGKSAKKKVSVAEKGARQTDSREIWLRRARESDILSGKASWYGRDFHNKATASGLDYDMHTFTAAHRTLPMGTVVKVTDARNGKSVMVCVTDRGPYVRDRIIDVSYAAAKQLDLRKRGVGRVELEVVSDEKGRPLKEGQAYFVRYGHGGDRNSVGPFKVFADAAAMHEALQQAHPEAEVVLDKSH